MDTADLGLDTQSTLNIDLTPVFEDLDNSGKDRKSTRLNSSHSQISYAVFCLKTKALVQKAHLSHLHPSKESRPQTPRREHAHARTMRDRPDRQPLIDHRASRPASGI